MKAYSYQFETTLKSGAALPPLVLIYGDDSGIIRQLAKAAANKVNPQDDPFSVDRLDAPQLQQSPGALRDAAATLSFGGGLKLVRVEGVMGNDRSALDALKAALDIYLEDVPEGAVVVVSVPELDAKNSIVGKIERHKTALAVRCYQDNSRGLEGLIDDALRSSGKRLAADARAFLKGNLGNDRGVTQSELEKLMIYAGENPEISQEDCLAVIAAAPSINVFRLCDAVGLRQRQEVDDLLQALVADGTDMNMAWSLVLRHLLQLRDCQNLLAGGMPREEAVLKSKGRIPPQAAAAFLQQASSYPRNRLNQLPAYTYNTIRSARQGTVDSQLILMRGISSLSA